MTPDMSSSKALSDLWREIRSSDGGIELAHLLKAAKVMAQTLVPEVDVKIGGMEYASTDGKVIEVTGKDLDTFPLPGDTVDMFLGLVVHEAGHCLFSENKSALLSKIQKTVVGGDCHELFSLMEVMEDIFVDFRMSMFPVYREYLRKTLAGVISNTKEVEWLGPLTSPDILQQEMINALLYSDMTGRVPQNIYPTNQAMLNELEDVVQQMLTGKLNRVAAVTTAWNIVRRLPQERTIQQQAPPPQMEPLKDKLPEEPPSNATPDKPKPQENKPPDKEEESPDNLPTDEDTDEPEEPGESDNNGDTDAEINEEDEEGDEECDTDIKDDTPTTITLPVSIPVLSDLINSPISAKEKIPPKLAKDINDAIVNAREDLSQMVAALAGKATRPIILQTPINTEDLTSIRVSTSSVEEHLRSIFRQYRDKVTSNYRGLYEGKISNRRLYKATYDYRVFQRRERPEEMNISFCLLMDCSGSMVGETPTIFKMVTSIADAMTKEKAEFIALGYSGGKVINIAKFFSPETGLNLSIEGLFGGTPSYEALAAGISHLLKSRRPRKILIHYTDGDASTGYLIPSLLVKAKAFGVEVYNFGPSQTNASYYGTVFPMSDLSELPPKIEEILRRSLK